MSTHPEPSIRAATSDDWPGIERLLRDRALPHEGGREHLDDFLLAESGRSLVGAIGLERYGRIVLLRSLAVAPEAEGRGLGARLVEALLERARRLGVDEVYLLTTSAAGYFPRFGFEAVSRAELPASLSASEQLRGACPASALPMRLRVGQASPGTRPGSSA